MGQPAVVRRKHSADFKDRVVADCLLPGAVISEIARGHELNDSVVRRWVAAHLSASAVATSTAAVKPAAFVPLRIGRASQSEIQPAVRPTALSAQVSPICIKVKRGDTQIKVEWPAHSAGECVSFLRELCR